MARRRRRGREPVWPLLLVVAVVAGGLGLGNAMSGGDGAEGPLAALDEAGSGGEVATGEIPTPEDRIRVEVLNGSGVQGVAARATEILRESGLDVVYFGNESSFGRDSSVVLDRTGRESALEAVGRVLDIGRLEAEPDTTRLVDITVLLGADWDPAAAGPPAEAAEAEDGRPWWDLGRFLEGGR